MYIVYISGICKKSYVGTFWIGLSCVQSHLMNGVSKSWEIAEDIALTGLLGPVLSNVRTLGPRNRTL